MQAETVLDLPRVRARERTLPARILVVDDDELELSLMSDRLTAVGYEVVAARDGAEALQLLDKEWFPVVIADWQMPVMDGIGLIKELRGRGNGECYFIMLSIRAEADDFERGYGAGVDDYLSKKAPDAELLARIEAGMNTVSLRRSLREAKTALHKGDVATTSTTNDAWMVRLRMELVRARRFRRVCSLMLIGVNVPLVGSESEQLLQAVRDLIRTDIDSADLLLDAKGAVRVAIVLPETGPAEVDVIRRRLCSGVSQRLNAQRSGKEVKRSPIKISIGAASVDTDATMALLSAEEMLRVSEHCLKCMSNDGKGHRAAVQASVVSQLSIPCRHGYAVADHCLELALNGKAEKSKATPIMVDQQN